MIKHLQPTPDWQQCFKKLAEVQAQLRQVQALLAFHSPAMLLHSQGLEIAHFIRCLVASHYGISIDDMDGAVRTERLVWPRHVAIFLCREITGLPCAEIGGIFGDRDHGTILHACENVISKCTLSEERRAHIAEIKALVQQHIQEEKVAA
jgi:chromosomal replication initiation ATPase DnaA